MKKKLTHIQRLYFYSEVLKWMKAQPNATEKMYENADRNLENAYIASFCSAIDDIDVKFRETEIGSDWHRLTSIEHLKELQHYKPDYAKRWQPNTGFWFHPYDKNTRIAILDKIIKRMNMTWFEKIVDNLKF